MKVKKSKNDELVDQLRQLSIRDKLGKNKSRDKQSNSLVKLFGAIGHLNGPGSYSRPLSRSFCSAEDSAFEFVETEARVFSQTRSHDAESPVDTSLIRGTSFSPASSCCNSVNRGDPFSSSAGLLHTTFQNGVFKTANFTAISKLRRSYTGLNSSSGYCSFQAAKITNSSSAAALSNLSGLSTTMHQLYSLVDFPLIQHRTSSHHQHGCRRSSGSVSARNSLPYGMKHSNLNANRHMINSYSKYNAPLFCYTGYQTKDLDSKQPLMLNSLSPSMLNNTDYDTTSRILPTNTPVDCFENATSTPVRTRRNSDPERWQQAVRARETIENPRPGLLIAENQTNVELPESSIVRTPVNTPAGLHSQSEKSPQVNLETDFTVNELASYLEYMVHIPGGKMSDMAQQMYL